MFHHIGHFPQRAVLATYAPSFAVAAIDHGASWVTLAGLAIGAGGLVCHAVMVVVRVSEWVEARRRQGR